MIVAMKASLLRRLGAGILFLAAGFPSEGQPHGLSARVPNTTLALPAVSPVYGYSVENAFGSLTFTDPVAIVSAPGETNRLFIVEEPGRLMVVTNLASPNRTLFLDLSSRVHYGGEEGLLGLAFHPGYASNGYFYVFYTLYTNATAGASSRHDRLSRFETAPGNANQALANSELVLINQRDEAPNHNGGDLHFGPDGYLYVSLGDEGGANDNFGNSQRIDKDFFSGILRLDVDQRPGSLAPNSHPASTGNYAVPADNPFVGATAFNGQPINLSAVRTEFWAVGLRNPWRIFFDRPTGLLYCADVGQDLWEEIDIITKGGNYGWNYREAMHPGPRTAPAGFTSIAPILEYGHGSGVYQGFSVTGGVVYRGQRIPELLGAYVFADYVSGNIWAIRCDGSKATPMQRLVGKNGIAAFGIDPATGDVLLADLGQDTIKRLVYKAGLVPLLPPTLAETGAFADLLTLTPNPGLVPYDVNVPFWSDHAVKTRWFSVPNPEGQMLFQAAGNWTFPTGAVWIKHFELELTPGVASSRRRLETRLLVRDKTAAGVYGITYRWDETQRSAMLVAEGGMDESLLVQAGETTRTQVWHYPGRAECLACHTTVGGGVLGFNTPQLNRPFNYGGVEDNQIRALEHAGYFTTPVSSLSSLPRLAEAADETVSVEYRVRSYLMANCAQCHQPGGLGLGFFDARIYSPLSSLQLVNGPLNDNGGDPANAVIRPGSLGHSMLLSRISGLGSGQMPPLGRSLVDTQAVALVSRWITDGLAGYQTFPEWQRVHFGSTNSAESAAGADPDGDGSENYLEFLVHTDPWLGSDSWGMGIGRDGDAVEIGYPRVANLGFEIQWTTNLDGAPSWQVLDQPENRPFFSAVNQIWRVHERISGRAATFYRVRVYEP